MLDFFKDYAKEYGVTAILGDSILVTSILLVASLLNMKSFKFNLIIAFIHRYRILYHISYI